MSCVDLQKIGNLRAKLSSRLSFQFPSALFFIIFGFITHWFLLTALQVMLLDSWGNALHILYTVFALYLRGIAVSNSRHYCTQWLQHTYHFWCECINTPEHVCADILHAVIQVAKWPNVQIYQIIKTKLKLTEGWNKVHVRKAIALHRELYLLLW